MECDGCTLCCKLLPVPWMDSIAGEYCRECNIDIGCKIYDSEIIHNDCMTFKCAYIQNENAPIQLRPDNCKIVFEKVADDIFIGTIDKDEKKLNKYAKGQIQSFLNQGYSVVLFNIGISKPFIYNCEGYDEDEVWQEILRIRERRKLNGTSLVSNRFS